MGPFATPGPSPEGHLLFAKAPDCYFFLENKIYLFCFESLIFIFKKLGKKCLGARQMTFYFLENYSLKVPSIPGNFGKNAARQILSFAQKIFSISNLEQDN